mmetsp:Transcript_83647/g.259907  ORF Transcript_83647/g.259907 Transcript_83647/m.259907 type:complete len:221 (+) Transcript_83647:185-847(+)
MDDASSSSCSTHSSERKSSPSRNSAESRRRTSSTPLVSRSRDWTTRTAAMRRLSISGQWAARTKLTYLECQFTSATSMASSNRSNRPGGTSRLYFPKSCTPRRNQCSDQEGNFRQLVPVAPKTASARASRSARIAVLGPLSSFSSSPRPAPRRRRSCAMRRSPAKTRTCQTSALGSNSNSSWSLWRASALLSPSPGASGGIAWPGKSPVHASVTNTVREA